MECGRLEKWVKTSNKHFFSNIGWHPQFLGHNPKQICICFMIQNSDASDKYSDLTLICLQWCTDRRWLDWVSRCHGWPGASPGPEVSAVSWCPTLTPRSGHTARCPDLLCHISSHYLSLCLMPFTFVNLWAEPPVFVIVDCVQQPAILQSVHSRLVSIGHQQLAVQGAQVQPLIASRHTLNIRDR